MQSGMYKVTNALIPESQIVLQGADERRARYETAVRRVYEFFTTPTLAAYYRISQEVDPSSESTIIPVILFHLV